ncbi:hypothetical protein ACTACM_06885 [Pseudomonas fragariae (ex Marin et al. 2024)]|uniref:Uncharacterized protein n=1 Tax=Pseudomonas syringae pv. papulans TaxID=83963 RepID=A0A3M3MCR8_PSESX|nr:hypothetical protein [Pseudomonas syringae]KWS31262.1 hypothetical protein AL059_17160 [Pseudomonas syringae pv. papulans]MDH4606838.1 hypothetical protein [Pseudomonas syringae pv. papulans]MDH4623327.1 hypothetical protein [Pseudomonas syringae pv. papulans]PBP67004.1 hypothetical protein CCL21_18770 [Pseudomonas syringae]RMN45296.1 hypothetical protein ALQ60_200199 [Pseudomonas syringae pv. papulans]
MGKVIAKYSLMALGVLFFLILIYASFKAYLSWSQGYSWQEMDWRQQGNTSIIDFFDASEIGKREVILGGNVCVEYYSYKDGLPIKTTCQK